MGNISTDSNRNSRRDDGRVATSLRLDPEVYKQAKIAALRRGRLTREYIEDALRDYNAKIEAELTEAAA